MPTDLVLVPELLETPLPDLELPDRIAELPLELPLLPELILVDRFPLLFLTELVRLVELLMLERRLLLVPLLLTLDLVVLVTLLLVPLLVVE